MTKITFKNQEAFHTSLQDIILDLDKKLEGIQNSFSSDMQKTPGKSYHLISKILSNPKNKDEEMVYKYLLSMVYRAEITSHDSGYVSLLFFVELAKSLLANSSLGILQGNQTNMLKSFEEFYEKLFSEINTSSRPVTKTEFNKHVHALAEDSVLGEVLCNALELAGLEGKIYIDNGKTENYIVESKTGYEFKCKPFDWFFDKFSNNWTRTNCKVLLVDGLIENVSEIESILQSLFESKQPMVFIAQGFSEEVVATLKANQEKGNFDAVPIRIMPDINSLNMINDISSVCNTQHVSHLKGQLLTFIKLEDLPTIDSITCYREKIVIQNSASVANVNEQIRYLLEKRQAESEIEDIQNIIDQRLRSLVGNSVNIHLPNSSAAVSDSIRIKADNALRAAKALLNYGLCDVAKVSLSSVNSELLTPVNKCAMDVFNKQKARLSELSVLTISISTLLGCKGAIMLLSSRGAVINNI